MAFPSARLYYTPCRNVTPQLPSRNPNCLHTQVCNHLHDGHDLSRACQVLKSPSEMASPGGQAWAANTDSGNDRAQERGKGTPPSHDHEPNNSSIFTPSLDIPNEDYDQDAGASDGERYSQDSAVRNRTSDAASMRTNTRSVR